MSNSPQNTMGAMIFFVVVFCVFRFFAGCIGYIWSIFIRTISGYPGSKRDPHPEADWFGWAVMLGALAYLLYDKGSFPYVIGFTIIIALRAALATYYIAVNKMPSIIDYED